MFLPGVGLTINTGNGQPVSLVFGAGMSAHYSSGRLDIYEKKTGAVTGSTTSLSETSTLVYSYRKNKLEPTAFATVEAKFLTHKVAGFSLGCDAYYKLQNEVPLSENSTYFQGYTGTYREVMRGYNRLFLFPYVTVSVQF